MSYQIAEALAKRVIASAIDIDEALRKTSDPLTGQPVREYLVRGVLALENVLEEIRIEYMEG